MRVTLFCLAVLSSAFVCTQAWAEKQSINVVGQVFCVEIEGSGSSGKLQKIHSNEEIDTSSSISTIKLRKKRGSEYGDQSEEYNGKRYRPNHKYKPKSYDKESEYGEVYKKEKPRYHKPSYKDSEEEYSGSYVNKPSYKKEERKPMHYRPHKYKETSHEYERPEKYHGSKKPRGHSKKQDSWEEEKPRESGRPKGKKQDSWEEEKPRGPSRPKGHPKRQDSWEEEMHRVKRESMNGGEKYENEDYNKHNEEDGVNPDVPTPRENDVEEQQPPQADGPPSDPPPQNLYEENTPAQSEQAQSQVQSQSGDGSQAEVQAQQQKQGQHRQQPMLNYQKKGPSDDNLIAADPDINTEPQSDPRSNVEPDPYSNDPQSPPQPEADVAPKAEEPYSQGSRRASKQQPASTGVKPEGQHRQQLEPYQKEEMESTDNLIAADPDINTGPQSNVEPDPYSNDSQSPPPSEADVAPKAEEPYSQGSRRASKQQPASTGVKPADEQKPQPEPYQKEEMEEPSDNAQDAEVEDPEVEDLSQNPTSDGDQTKANDPTADVAPAQQDSPTDVVAPPNPDSQQVYKEKEQKPEPRDLPMMMRSDDDGDDFSHWGFIPIEGPHSSRLRRSALARNGYVPKLTPVRDAEIQLFEYDKITSDDLLATTHTDSDGFFNISGTDSEFNLIRPYLIIKHQCPSIFPEYKNCKFTTRIELPYADPEQDSTRNMVIPLSGASTKVQCN